MSTLLNYFRREITILRKKYEGNSLAIDPVLPEIEALIKAYAKTGQSGASAALTGPMIVETIKKTLSFEPLSELTGDDDEWNIIGETENREKDIFQNRRYSTVFKEGKDGKPYYLDGLRWWDTVSNVIWTATVKLPDNRTLSSRVYIKDLSKFDGKSFRIIVQEREKGSDIYIIQNPEILKEAEKVYELIYRN